MRLSGCGGRLSAVAVATSKRRCSGDRTAMLGQAAGTRRRAAAASMGRSTCCNAAAGRAVVLLDVVRMPFGRVIGRAM